MINWISNTLNAKRIIVKLVVKNQKHHKCLCPTPTQGACIWLIKSTFISFSFSFLFNFFFSCYNFISIKKDAARYT